MNLRYRGKGHAQANRRAVCLFGRDCSRTLHLKTQNCLDGMLLAKEIQHAGPVQSYPGRESVSHRPNHNATDRCGGSPAVADDGTHQGRERCEIEGSKLISQHANPNTAEQ